MQTEDKNSMECCFFATMINNHDKQFFEEPKFFKELKEFLKHGSPSSIQKQVLAPQLAQIEQFTGSLPS